MPQTIDVDPSYDLPYAIAYGKLSAFLWEPLDIDHRVWKKIGTNLILSQKHRGAKVTVDGNVDRHCLYRILGLWYEASDCVSEQPRVIKLLFREIPVRQSWADHSDLDILFAAAILSPQVSWEVNLKWILYIRKHFGKYLLAKIANLEPKELGEIIQGPDLRKLGYHARILVKSFQDIRDKLHRTDKILKMKAQEARKTLLQVYGIGPKISTFVVQTSHGDLNSPCIDRHVLRNAVELGVVTSDSQPYFPGACMKYIDDCSKCPYVNKCAAGQLMRFKGSSIASSILYFIDA